MMRIGEYAMTFSQNNIMRELSNYSLEKLVAILTNFYQQFRRRSGGQIKRFVRSFETIHDTIVFTFGTPDTACRNFLILFYVAPLGNFLLFGALFIF